MTTTAHAVAPEEVMAWVDGELAESEARAVAAHVEECAECAAVAAGFRRMSEELAGWDVAAVPGWVEAAVMRAAEAGAKEYPHGRRESRGTLRPAQGRLWGTRSWVVGIGGGVLALVLIVMAGSSLFRAHPSPPSYVMMESQSQGIPLLSSERRRDSTANDIARMDIAPAQAAGVAEQRMRAARAQAPLTANRGNLKNAGTAGGAPLAATEVSAPMIARTVSLTVRVKAVSEARAELEAVLARHHGYMAQMNANTMEGSARMFTASTRIPAADVEASLKELRTLGRVESESQTGEEVTQQHEDLAVRLKTARETEARFQGILAQRTGSVSDVLEVEQEIARVRGEIESMEAEQAGLEHRVEFATVDLTLMENYQATFSTPDSAGMRVRNAFVAGYENGWQTVVGMVVFGAEYGPAILIWGMVLGVPVWWVWWRWRRVRSLQ